MSTFQSHNNSILGKISARGSPTNRSSQNQTLHKTTSEPFLPTIRTFQNHSPQLNYLNEYNSQVKLSLLKNLSNIETNDLNNQLQTYFKKDNATTSTTPLPKYYYTRSDTYRMPNNISSHYGHQNQPDPQKRILNAYKPKRDIRSKKEIHTLERIWNAGLSKCTEKQLDKNMRKIGVLNVELGKEDLNQQATFGSENVVFDLIYDEAIKVCKTIKFWIAGISQNHIFKSIDMNNDKFLTIDEIHRQVIRNYIKTNNYTLINQQRKIIKLAVKATSTNIDHRINMKEFNELMKYIKLWHKMYLCFREVDINEDMDLQLDEFKEQCKLLGFSNPKKMVDVFNSLDCDRSGTVSLFEFSYAFTEFIIKNNIMS